MDKNHTQTGQNDSGYILVGTLLLLAIVSLIGISSSRTSDLEVQIGGNDKYYKEKQYLAEAAAMELIQYVRNQKRVDQELDTEVLTDRSDAVLNQGSVSNGLNDGVRDLGDWTLQNEEENEPGANARAADLVPDDFADLSVMGRALGSGGTAQHSSEDTISKGGSLQSMTQSSDHTFVIVGSYVDANVNIAIETGFRTRF